MVVDAGFDRLRQLGCGRGTRHLRQGAGVDQLGQQQNRTGYRFARVAAGVQRRVISGDHRAGVHPREKRRGQHTIGTGQRFHRRATHIDPLGGERMHRIAHQHMAGAGGQNHGAARRKGNVLAVKHDLTLSAVAIEKDGIGAFFAGEIIILRLIGGAVFHQRDHRLVRHIGFDIRKSNQIVIGAYSSHTITSFQKAVYHKMLKNAKNHSFLKIIVLYKRSAT